MELGDRASAVGGHGSGEPGEGERGAAERSCWKEGMGRATGWGFDAAGERGGGEARIRGALRGKAESGRTRSRGGARSGT